MLILFSIRLTSSNRSLAQTSLGLEAESGIPSGKVNKITDPLASQGRAIEFRRIR